LLSHIHAPGLSGFSSQDKGGIDLPGYSVLEHYAGVATVLDRSSSRGGKIDGGKDSDSGRGGEGIARETSQLHEDTSTWEAHPLLELMARGREIAVDHQRKRESVDTLERAVEDYQEAFGMAPPEGFEVW
jgi:hypothetical protein